MVPFEHTKASMFCTPFSKVYKILDCQSIKISVFAYFQAFPQEVQCVNQNLSALPAICGFLIHLTTWGSKYSTFPYDKGSVLKHRMLRTCNTVPKEKRMKVLN